MSRRVLVTTSIEESWPVNGEPIVFLGECCRRFSRRAAWQGLDHEVVPYHWNQPDKLYRDYKYLDEVFEEAIAALSERLNQVHEVRHEPRYWRILAGPWLIRFLHLLFDRYESIRKSLEYDVSTTFLLSGVENLPPATDTKTFHQYVYSDLWNHQIVGHMLKHMRVIDSVVVVDTADRYDLPLPAVSNVMDPRWRALRLFDRLASRLSSRNDLLMYATYLHPWDEIRLCIKLRQIPLVRSLLPGLLELSANRIDPDHELRRWLLPLTAGDEFRQILAAEIPRHLPMCLMEGYGSLVGQADALNWPSTPKAIWTSNAHYSDDVFNAWTAQKVQDGHPLVVGQHGGTFGPARFTPYKDHERNISDLLLTWGWTEDNGHCYAPVGHFPRNYRPSGVRHASQPKGVLVTHTFSRMAFEAYAGVMGSRWLEYFDFLCRFVETLPEEIRRDFIVRTTARDAGWDEGERWKDRFPSMTVDDGKTQLKNLYGISRLCVATANTTVFQEAFLLQIPTVILWDPLQWELKESAQPVFDNLKNAKVFHSDPMSAARHVADIWEDCDVWWKSDEVQTAVNGFNDCFNLGPEGLLERIRNALAEASPKRSTALPAKPSCPLNLA